MPSALHRADQSSLDHRATWASVSGQSPRTSPQAVCELPVKRIAGRSSLLAPTQLLHRAEFLQQLANRLWAIREPLASATAAAIVGAWTSNPTNLSFFIAGSHSYVAPRHGSFPIRSGIHALRIGSRSFHCKDHYPPREAAMKVFVTGATGAIGRPAVSALVAAGHRVTALARTNDKAEWLRRQGATPAQLSLFDKDALVAAFRGCDAVINLATALPASGDFHKIKCLGREHSDPFPRLDDSGGCSARGRRDRAHPGISRDDLSRWRRSLDRRDLAGR